MMKELERIYKESDKNLRRDKANLISFANHKGYKYYAEYVCDTLSSGKSAREIINEMGVFGIKLVPGISSVWGTKYRVSERLKDKQDKQDKKSKIKKKGYCYACDYKRKIATGNHALCKECSKKAKSADICPQHGFANNCAY